MTSLSTNEIISFAVLSIIIIFFSRQVLFNPKAHGFYRLFGWEGIAWLAVNNYKYWFENAFSIFQIISWILLLYSLLLVLSGVVLLHSK